MRWGEYLNSFATEFIQRLIKSSASHGDLSKSNFPVSSADLPEENSIQGTLSILGGKCNTCSVTLHKTFPESQKIGV